jgi:hypothetical protein
MMHDQRARLLFEVATNRMVCVSLLTHSSREKYPTGVLLHALTLEIILKAALITAGKKYTRQDTHLDLWQKLPKNVQDRVVAAALQEHGGVASFDNIPTVLRANNQIIETARYPLDELDELANTPITDVDEPWKLLALETGSVYPVETDGLLIGLAKYIESEFEENKGHRQEK